MRRSLQSIERMAEVARGEGICSQLVVAYGDSSPLPVFTNDIFNGLREEFSESIVLEYTYFNSNLGSAGGHNTLNESNNSEFLLLQNPDVIVSSRMLEFLMKPFLIANVGIVEAKQMPIEHSKEYDPITGETSWASGACTLIPTPLFNHIGGYDSDTFFLYCDDVDLSWMVVEAGFKVIFQPSALVFHDKRLTHDAGWVASTAERYYSAEAALLIAYKWSRDDLRKQILEHFINHGDEFQKKASEAFDTRLKLNRLPRQRDADHKVAFFEDNMYARYRYQV